MEKEIIYQHFSSLPSTNTYAREQIATFDLNALTALSTHKQTAGRGTKNKSWLCHPGSLFLTLVFKAISHPEQIGLVLALIACEVIEEVGLSPRIRWPNDILIGGKKCGGILIEQCEGFLIAGIGINLDVPKSVLEKVDQPATSLYGFKEEFVRHQITERFCQALSLFEREGFTPFYMGYRKRVAFIGEQVTVTTPKERLEGRLVSVRHDGLLQLEISPNEMITIVTGQIRQV